MDDWEEGVCEGESEFHEPLSGDEIVKGSKTVNAVSITSSEEASESSEPLENSDLFWEKIEEGKQYILLAIAGRQLTECSDPVAHKEESVRRAIAKVLQAETNRHKRYETPFKVLCRAVKQEAIRHNQICERELAVDFEAPFELAEESDVARPIGYSPREVAQETSYNPRQIYDQMMDLDELLSKIHDPELKHVFERYIVWGETLTEIAEKANWTIMKTKRRRDKLLKELERLKKEFGFDDDAEGTTSDRKDDGEDV